jgi:UPF0758 protein fjoh_0413
MSLKDISIYDRPREKAEIYGVKTLSDIELLAIIIETGYHGENVLSLAAKLLEKSGGLSNLSKLNLSELNIKGLKKAKSIRLLAAIELGKRASSNIEFSVPIKDSNDLFLRFKNLFINEPKEKAYVISLDNKKRPIKITEIGNGGEFTCKSDLKLAIQESIKVNASFMILMHNHPLGEANPSAEDDVTTALLESFGRMIGTRLLDHIIVGENGYYSYVDNRKINC